MHTDPPHRLSTRRLVFLALALVAGGCAVGRGPAPRRPRPPDEPWFAHAAASMPDSSCEDRWPYSQDLPGNLRYSSCFESNELSFVRLYLTLQNPADREQQVEVRCRSNFEEVGQGEPVIRTYSLPPRSRRRLSFLADTFRLEPYEIICHMDGWNPWGQRRQLASWVRITVAAAEGYMYR